MLKFETVASIGNIPLNGKVLVQVDLKGFNQKRSAGGILMPNAAHADAEAASPGYSLDEFMIRKGVVAGIPKQMCANSYDWKSNLAAQVGDMAYWPIITFFDMPAFFCNGMGYLLVDCHEIHLIRRGGTLIPMNGFCIFEGLYDKTAAFEFEVKEPSMYYRLMVSGDPVVYDNVCMNEISVPLDGSYCVLSVPPYKLVGDLDEEFALKNLYMAQHRHILASRNDLNF